MDNKLFAGLAVILLVGAGCANVVTDNNQNQALETSEITAADTTEGNLENDMVDTTAPLPYGDDGRGDEGIPFDNVDVKNFTVTGDNFTFSPTTMTVKKGETVRITFKNMEGFHDLVIDEFNVATKQMGAEAEETVEFVADQAGSFEYYCSVGSHRAMGMKGTLIVTE